MPIGYFLFFVPNVKFQPFLTLGTPFNDVYILKTPLLIATTNTHFKKVIFVQNDRELNIVGYFLFLEVIFGNKGKYFNDVEKTTFLNIKLA